MESSENGEAIFKTGNGKLLPVGNVSAKLKVLGIFNEVDAEVGNDANLKESVEVAVTDEYEEIQVSNEMVNTSLPGRKRALDNIDGDSEPKSSTKYFTPVAKKSAVRKSAAFKPPRSAPKSAPNNKSVPQISTDSESLITSTTTVSSLPWPPDSDFQNSLNDSFLCNVEIPQSAEKSTVKQQQLIAEKVATVTKEDEEFALLMVADCSFGNDNDNPSSATKFPNRPKEEHSFQRLTESQKQKEIEECTRFLMEDTDF